MHDIVIPEDVILPPLLCYGLSVSTIQVQRGFLDAIEETYTYIDVHFLDQSHNNSSEISMIT